LSLNVRATMPAASLVLAFALFAAAPAPAETEQPVFQDKTALLVAGPLGDIAIGAEDAPVTMIEYASMTCPHCAHFDAEILPELKKKYIDTGKVRLIFREFPLDRLAVAAAMLARCVDKEKFFPFVDVLFKNQLTWATEHPLEPLKELSKQAGLSEDSFDKCLANQEVLDGIVWVQDRAQKEFEVHSTPTFFINGREVRGAVPVAEFEQIIDAQLNG